MEKCHALGAIVGATTGVGKAVTAGITAFSFLSWDIIGETSVLALCGGIFGGLGAELVKQVKKEVLERKKQRNDNLNKQMVAKSIPLE